MCGQHDAGGRFESVESREEVWCNANTLEGRSERSREMRVRRLSTSILPGWWNVDTLGLGPSAFECAGSSPVPGTEYKRYMDPKKEGLLRAAGFGEPLIDALQTRDRSMDDQILPGDHVKFRIGGEDKKGILLYAFPNGAHGVWAEIWSPSPNENRLDYSMSSLPLSECTRIPGPREL